MQDKLNARLMGAAPTGNGVANLMRICHAAYDEYLYVGGAAQRRRKLSN